MNTNDPETPPEIQLTPVAFSPTQSEESFGLMGPPPTPPPFQFPVFWPNLIVLLTLIYSTTADIVTMNKRITVINQLDAPALDLLKQSGKQSEFIEGVRIDLQKLSTSDPLAARYLAQYFPSAPAQKVASPEAASPTPAK